MSERTPPSAERIWQERLCRKLGCNPIVGPVLDSDGIDIVHELLRELGKPDRDARTCARLGTELAAAQVRVEDGHAKRLGLPLRPR